MDLCKKHIESIYTHPAFNNLISKIKPIELQDDLRQEVAFILLSKECEQILRLNENDELLKYSLQIVWNLATSKNTRFYKMFKRNQTEDAIRYFETLSESEVVSDDQINKANEILESKMNLNANSAHESILFNKYIELRSCEKVAEYYGIPSIHCYEVIRKTKKELIKAIRNDS